MYSCRKTKEAMSSSAERNVKKEKKSDSEEGTLRSPVPLDNATILYHPNKKG